jgi:hypothetical protein
MKTSTTVFAASAPLALFGSLALVAFVQEERPAAPAPAASATSAVQIELYEVAMRREPKTEGVTLFGNAGTDLKIAVVVPGASLLRLDEEKSKIAKWTDDAGTDLTPTEDSWWFWAQMDGRWDEEARMDLATLTLHTDRLPASGANRITLESTLVFVDAGDLTTSDVAAPLTLGAKFTLAGVEMKVAALSEIEDSETVVRQIELQSSKPLDALQSMVMKDAEGNEIVCEEMGSGSMGMFGKTTYSYYYGLGKAVDAATITATYYARMGTVEVPLKLSAGVGL